MGVKSGAHQEGDSLAITRIQEVRPPTWLEQQFPRVWRILMMAQLSIPTDWSIDDSETNSYIDLNGMMGTCGTYPPRYTGDPANAPNTPSDRRIDSIPALVL